MLYPLHLTFNPHVFFNLNFALNIDLQIFGLNELIKGQIHEGIRRIKPKVQQFLFSRA
jgi:hypothetical protein